MSNRARRALRGAALMAALMAAGMAVTQAETWVPIQGNVRLADGTPLCAMVLANGQYMFSCDGTGSYSLYVPLDDKGQVTLFSFADGFAPFRITADPKSFPFSVQMQTAASGRPAPSIVGVWGELSGGGESNFVALSSDGTFITQNPVSEDCGKGVFGGTEVGTYSYDETSHSLRATSVTYDGNGDCGLADFGAIKPSITVWRDGNVANIIENDGYSHSLPLIQ